MSSLKKDMAVMGKQAELRGATAISLKWFDGVL